MSGTPRESRDGGIGILRFRTWIDRFRQSLFFLPALFVLGSMITALALVEVDRGLGNGDLPEFFATTVDNARSILATIAGGTIGAASVVFSLTLVAVQLASSQFSPRVLRGFLGDTFQQFVMGIVVGTFTYSLLVLRVVRAPLDANTGEPFLPQISVIVAVVLAVASLLAVLASIDHTAKRLRVGSVLDRIAEEALGTIDTRYPNPVGDEDDTVAGSDIEVVAERDQPQIEERGQPDDALVVHAKRSGWVTQLSMQGLIEAAPEGSTVLLDADVGDYLVTHTPAVRLWPVAEDDRQRTADALRAAIEVRKTRTMQQDVEFGVLQLVDVALRALSPGINDPNTAIEALGRIGTVMATLLRRTLHSRVVETEKCTVIRAEHLDYRQYLDGAFDPILRYSRTEPMVLASMARTLGFLRWGAPPLSKEAGEAVDARFDAIEHDLELIPVERDRIKVKEALEHARTDPATIGESGR